MWAVKPGMWASVWFTTDTRQYIARMARVLLGFARDKRRLLAKRIGQRLLLLGQARRPRMPFEVSLQELPRDAGELLKPETRNYHWASRSREILEAALELLKTHKVIKAVEWPEGYGPDDLDRSKGWGHRWLNARIRVITMAHQGRGSACGLRLGGKVRDGADAGRFNGNQIRSARTKHHAALDTGTIG